MPEERPYQSLSDAELTAWVDDIVASLPRAYDAGTFMSDPRRRILTLLVAEQRARR